MRRLGQLGHDRNYTFWGTRPEHMGDALPAVNFSLPVVSMDSGGGFSCGVLNDSSVRCWGANYFGQLGFSDARANT